MIDVICIPCERLRNQINQQLPFMRKVAKQRAIENDSTYCIVFDKEDNKLICQRAETAQNCDIIEYISKHT